MQCIKIANSVVIDEFVIGAIGEERVSHGISNLCWLEHNDEKKICR